jgi:hypothetical protein
MVAWSGELGANWKGGWHFLGAAGVHGVELGLGMEMNTFDLFTMRAIIQNLGSIPRVGITSLA